MITSTSEKLMSTSDLTKPPQPSTPSPWSETGRMKVNTVKIRRSADPASIFAMR